MHAGTWAFGIPTSENTHVITCTPQAYVVYGVLYTTLCIPKCCNRDKCIMLSFHLVLKIKRNNEGKPLTIKLDPLDPL